MKNDWKKIISEGKSILLFDGVCNLCNGVVQFVLPRDVQQKFVFASLQSEEGLAIQKHFHLDPEKLDTLILIHQQKLLKRSNAALTLFQNLGGLWPLSRIFWIVPGSIRVRIYDWVAHNRYRWFGKQDQCMLPRPEWKERFL